MARRKKNWPLFTAKTDEHGYVWIKLPWDHPMVTSTTNWVKEHRLVAFEEGWIVPGDPRHVHHKNLNRSDNRPENLEVMSGEEHSEYHTVGWAEHPCDLAFM